MITPGSWKFDEIVAKRFYQEAVSNIPDYEKVVEMIGPIIRKLFREKSLKLKILDVGSAIGFTVNKLQWEGFVNTYGVESSLDMIKHSQCGDHIFHCSELPHGLQWDVIIINWTLHFIKDRKKYLEAVYEALTPGGLLFLTEKTLNSSEEEKKDYINFKKGKGISLEEINAKALALDGILIPFPIEWYYDTLQELGFKNILMINSRFMFKTLIARKLE